MKLEAIFEEWNKDSEIDMTELGNEAIKIPKLHHKYFQVYSSEKLLLRKYEAEMKSLKLAKYEFYTQGPSRESQEKGWTLPARGMILKQEMPMYIEGDQDIINLSLKIGMQQEKVELLESIIKSLTNRGFQIKSAIDWNKFTMGA
jgi:Recombination, repair and ssDNA binding protein UvsY